MMTSAEFTTRLSNRSARIERKIDAILARAADDNVWSVIVRLDLIDDSYMAVDQVLNLYRAAGWKAEITERFGHSHVELTPWELVGR